MGHMRERAKMAEGLGISVLRKDRPDLGIMAWQNAFHEPLRFGGTLVVLHLKPDGLPRAFRGKVGDDIKYCRNYLLAQAIIRERRKKVAFDAERVLQIPYELRDRIAGIRLRPNLIVNAGENYLVDAFQNLTEPENLKFHGIGTGTTAVAETDTALVTELTTQYSPTDSTRATGSLTEGASSNIFRTVGTNTVDATVTIGEWGLFSQAATPGGTMWSRVLVSPTVGLNSGDSLQTTYDLTVE